MSFIVGNRTAADPAPVPGACFGDSEVGAENGIIRPELHSSFLTDTGDFAMAYVVTESCIRCKYTDCATVCPVACFHEGPNFLVIDPDECIDCDVCVPECPVDAIYPEDELPPGQEQFLELNAQLAREWPVIEEKRDPPADAEQWAEVKDKLQYLER